MLRLTAIGSCRVANPLRRAEARGLIGVNAARIYGYTHTPAEALQQVRWLSGEIALPEAVAPLVMPGQSPAQAMQAARHVPSDHYLVELSSAKDVRAGGIPVQLNYVQRHFATVLSDRAFSAAFWRLATGASEDRKNDLIDSSPACLALPPGDLALLRSLTATRVTPDSLRSDLAAIADRLPGLLVVTHCAAATADGRPLATRSAFVAEVAAAARDLGLDCFQPAAVMAGFGQARALLDQGGSLSHYTPDFEDALADRWIAMLDPAAARRAAAVPA
jgi:hypothetical protein